jgi:metal-responsive CopG/Arc/MetJ family transcriptional regulator
MPRIKVAVPEELLKVAAESAEQLGKNLDELYVEAIERYVESTKNASAGSVRSRFIIPRSAPQIVVEIPEELYLRADKAAKRQGKQRQIIYADALYKHLTAAGATADSAFDRGHDLPDGAWRPTGSS